MAARRDILDKLGEIGKKAPPPVVGRLAALQRESGVRLSAEELTGLSMVLAAAGALVGLIAGGFVIGLVTATAAGAMPALGCKAVSGFRSGNVARQLEKNAEALAEELQGGKRLTTALSELARRAGPPLGDELRRILAEHQLGMPLEDALRRFARRVRTSETVQVTDVLLAHLEHQKDPLDLVRQINFQKPFEMPPLAPEGPPGSFEELVHRLHERVIDAIDPRTLTSGEAAAIALGRVDSVVSAYPMPTGMGAWGAAAAQAVKDQIGGRGPLEGLLRVSSLSSLYVASPRDVFADSLPPELLDTAPPPDAQAAPDGYSRANVRFRDAAHLRQVTERVLAPLSASVSPANPVVEGSLPDGWGVAAQLTESGTIALVFGRGG